MRGGEGSKWRVMQVGSDRLKVLGKPDALLPCYSSRLALDLNGRDGCERDTLLN